MVWEGFQLLTKSIDGIAQWPVVNEDLESRRRRRELYAELQSIPGLSVQDGLTVARSLLADPMLLSHFVDFPP